MSNDLTITGTTDGVYVRNLVGYTPPPRYGTSVDPWAQVRVEESTGEAGPWTELGSGPLEPVDEDPTQPAAWNITVTGATTPTGWYRAVWLDTEGNEQPSEPAYFGPPVRPSVKDIAKLLPQRATLDGGARAYTFNNETDPTGEDVDGLIDIALDQTLLEIPDLPLLAREQVAQTRAAVGYMAAILVENAHFSEQVNAGESLAGTYQTFYDNAILKLAGAVDGDLPGGPSAFAVTTGTDYVDTLDTAGRLPWDWRCC